MAKDNNIGIKISTDVADLKSGISEIKKEINQTNKDFNSATAGLDKWSSSSYGLNEKLKQLNKNLTSQKKTVSLYQDEIERVSKLEGDHSAELANLKSKLQDAETQVKKTEKEISHYSSSLEEVSKKEKEEQSTLGKLTKKISEQEDELKTLQKEYKNAVLTYGKNSKEAKNLEKQIGDLSGSLDKNRRQVKFADKQLELLDNQFDETGNSAEKFSDGLKGIKKLGATVGKAVAGIGATVAGLTTAFLATAESTKEFRTNMGKLEAGFETSGLSAKQATDTYKELYSVVADEGKATEATAMLGQLTNSQKELNEWTNILTGVYATFGDSLPIEGLAEASLETAKTGKITGQLADALNWAGISEDDFQASLDACTNEQERQKLITETLNKTYSEASKKYQEVNKDVIESNKSQVELTETMAELGAKAEPILTTVKEGFNQLMQAVIALMDGVDFSSIESAISSAFSFLINTIIPTIVEGLKWIIDNKDILITGITAIGTAMLAWNVVSIIQGVVGAIKAWTVATEGMTIAQKLLNLAMAANPIGIIISLVAGLVAGIVLLWNKNEGFRKAMIGAWNAIKNAFVVAWNAIKNAFVVAWNAIKSVWNSTVNFFSGIVSSIGNAFKSIPDKLKSVFTTAWNGIKNAFSKVTSFFTDIGNKIINAFKTLPTKIIDVGTNLVKGLWNGIKDATGWVLDKIKGFGKSVLNGIKGIFGIHSPSKETAKIGDYMAQGLANGLEDGKGEVIDAGEDLGNAFTDTFEETVGGADPVNIESLNSIIDSQKSKIKELSGQYQNACATFGSTSQQAYALGRQIISVTRELAENEKKVKGLNDNYKNLSGTLADQMRIELNNAKNAKKSLEEQADSLRKKMNEANKAGYTMTAQGFYKEWMQATSELELQNSTIKELTANLDYMANNSAKVNRALNGTIDAKVLNEYEKLNEAIKAQKEQLNKLKTAYESAVLVYGANSDEAKKIADNIKKVTNELESNEQKVYDLDNAYDTMMSNMSNESGFQKFLTQNEKSLEKWKKGVGKTVSAVGDTFEKAFSSTSKITSELLNFENQLAENKKNEIDAELAKFNETKDAELEKVKADADEESKLLEERYKNKKLTEKMYNDAKLKLEQKVADKEEQIAKEKEQREQEALKKKDEIARKQFESQKKVSIAEALIQGAIAIVKGFGQLGPIGGAINAAIQAGITAVQVATIASQQYVPMLAKGGVVDGATLAVIGEQGKEAVMPLENNTGWITELAEKLSAVMQKDFSIGLTPQLQPAYAGQPIVNNYYNQTINSPKALTRREIYRDSKNLLALKG